jgi:hypothetical protein
LVSEPHRAKCGDEGSGDLGGVHGEVRYMRHGGNSESLAEGLDPVDRQRSPKTLQKECSSREVSTPRAALLTIVVCAFNGQRHKWPLEYNIDFKTLT